MDKEDLLKLIADDELGLLKVKPKQSSIVTSDERLVASFENINKFISENGREPKTGNGVQEHQLYSRLKGIRESTEKVTGLMGLDVHGLLVNEVKELKTIADIFEDDDLDILNNEADSIFTLKHVKKHSRAEAESIARRTVCKDFSKYEPLFVKVHDEIHESKRKLIKFHDKGEQLVAGQFYILSGILLYLESVDLTSEEKTVAGKRFRKDGRTRCIFENGTESNMLYRSLVKQLLTDGRLVTDTNENLNQDLYKNMNDITEEDEETGYIYVLRSLSTKHEIQSINNLYKIGFSRVPVEERIKNAENEPTYLMAPVSIVTAYQCFNMNPQKLEQLLHNFFGSSCLNMDVFDSKGKRHTPREWFVAPLDIIEQAINSIINGDIVNYKYDNERKEIVER